MKKEYYLFLDETKPNAHGNYFALGGYAILKDDYENILIPKLSKIKNDLMPNPELPLHSVSYTHLTLPTNSLV